MESLAQSVACGTFVQQDRSSNLAGGFFFLFFFYPMRFIKFNYLINRHFLQLGQLGSISFSKLNCFTRIRERGRMVDFPVCFFSPP